MLRRHREHSTALTKGKIERQIQYLRHAFFAARPFRDLDDINAQYRRWRDDIAHRRPHPDQPHRRVADVWAEERPRLLPLPAHPFETDLVRAVRSGKTPYVRFDRNLYSIPHTHVRKRGGRASVRAAASNRSIWLSVKICGRMAWCTGGNSRSSGTKQPRSLRRRYKHRFRTTRMRARRVPEAKCCRVRHQAANVSATRSTRRTTRNRSRCASTHSSTAYCRPSDRFSVR